VVQNGADRSGLSGGGIVFFVITITIFSSALAQPTSWFGEPDLASILLGLWECHEMETALIETVTDPKCLPLLASVAITFIGVLGFIVRAGWQSWHEA
jgi:hypothetical protein